jgi:phage shock protein E
VPLNFKKNNMRFILVFLLTSMVILSCKEKKEPVTEPQNAESVTVMIGDIDIPTAKKMLAESPEIVLLDVRTPEEIALGKIGEAVEMDFTSPGFKEKVAALDKNKEYIVYCAAGGRSAKAVNMMKDIGFEKAYNLTGGYTGWSKEQ